MSLSIYEKVQNIKNGTSPEPEQIEFVINSDFGGYCLTEAAYEELGFEWDGIGMYGIRNRSNPSLVACVKKLGSLAGDSLKIESENIDSVNLVYIIEKNGFEDFATEENSSSFDEPVINYL